MGAIKIILKNNAIKYGNASMNKLNKIKEIDYFRGFVILALINIHTSAY